MQVLKQLSAVVVLGAVVAACGGGAATQAPGATQGGGGGGNGATQPPAGATTDPGPGETAGGGDGGNTIDFTYGKATFSTTGPITAQGEYGFIPMGSMFGGAQGSVLNFASSTGSDGNLLSVIVSADNSVTVSFSSTALGQIPGSTCTTSDWNIGSGTASGKFDCTAQFSITPSGAVVEGGTIKGEFNART